MGDKSAIEWTEATWNPTVGCSRISSGCQNCYAEVTAHRGLAPQHRGLTKMVNGHPTWTGEIRFVESALHHPLRWRRPRRVFVNSMSDLFHDGVEDTWIEQIFQVMARAPQHTFQILTKRPERMLEWVTRARPVPLPNVWLGVSVEDQETGGRRIPRLLQTPAAVQWVSYEPALGPVDFSGWLPALSWIVIGGESGPSARPFEVAWARATLEQCRVGGVRVFVKQLGARPRLEGHQLRLVDRKGGDMAEWPADLRVREYPAAPGRIETNG